MEKKTYTIKGGSPHPLPSLIGGEALAEAGSQDLRVLFALCELETADAETLAAALTCETAAVTAALAFWRGAGIIAVQGAEGPKQSAPPAKPASPPASSVPKGGAEELAETIPDSRLAELIATAEQQRGRLFNRTDLAILVSMSTELGLDSVYILTLLSFCDSQGDGEAKPLRYAERVALRLIERGIDTPPALEEYIREQELLRSAEGGLRRMFGLGSRKLTAREEAAFLTWIRDYGYSEELIGAAYDVTVNATGKASVAYTDKILSRWHAEGVRTLQDAEAALAKAQTEKKPGRQGGAKKPAAEPKTSSFDVGDFFQKAINRSYKTDTGENP